MLLKVSKEGCYRFVMVQFLWTLIFSGSLFAGLLSTASVGVSLDNTYRMQQAFASEGDGEDESTPQEEEETGDESTPQEEEETGDESTPQEEEEIAPPAADLNQTQQRPAADLNQTQQRPAGPLSAQEGLVSKLGPVGGCEYNPDDPRDPMNDPDACNPCILGQVNHCVPKLEEALATVQTGPLTTDLDQTTGILIPTLQPETIQALQSTDDSLQEIEILFQDLEEQGTIPPDTTNALTSLAEGKLPTASGIAAVSELCPSFNLNKEECNTLRDNPPTDEAAEAAAAPAVWCVANPITCGVAITVGYDILKWGVKKLHDCPSGQIRDLLTLTCIDVDGDSDLPECPYAGQVRDSYTQECMCPPGQVLDFPEGAGEARCVDDGQQPPDNGGKTSGRERVLQQP